jgi:hypothetical protein
MPDFVPADFQPPSALDHPRFRLRPLGPEHNVSDYAAWTSSIDHIHATPGWEDSTWPEPMTLEENLGDLQRHAADFAARTGFTYTVLAPDDDTVIGCVYLYPSKEAGRDARANTWVRATDPDLDRVLYETVTSWLAESWPFRNVEFAPRT